MSHISETSIAVIGGGLVGALEACLLAKRGYRVTIFESRHDGRNESNYYGRSINLAISHRGIRALKFLGLDHIVKELGIPMGSRMIHDLKGNQTPIPYDPDGRCINSIERALLNNYLLNVAERDYKVDIKFNHKLVDLQAKTGQLTLLVNKNDSSDPNNNSADNNSDQAPHEKIVKFKADLIFGCDGARSSVRSLMGRFSQIDITQSFIEHCYLELRIEPRESDGDFKMSPNSLHIWPRGQFMMIALANKDKTFTCTLFIPTKIIERLRGDPTKALEFFEKHFPDSIKLIGAQSIKDTLTSVRPSPLISIYCNPYHYGGRIVLLGDSAHAMVPFYGQGMNCGFEDCLVLDELIGESLEIIPEPDMIKFDPKVYEKIFQRYSELRVANGQSMGQVAMYNYIEMRDLVNTWSFKMRKLFDSLLYRLFPSKWIPFYTMITFTHLPVNECVKLREKQDKILRVCQIFSASFVVLATSALVCFKLSK